MGTELGISRFIVSEVQSLLPEWLLPSTFESDIMAAEPVEPSPVAAVPEDVVLEDDLAGAGAPAMNPAPVEAQPQPEPASKSAMQRICCKVALTEIAHFCHKLCSWHVAHSQQCIG